MKAPNEARQRKKYHFVVQNYHLRIIATLLFLLMFATISEFYHDPRRWVLMGFLLLWPHLFYWVARRAQSGYQAEVVNIQGDGFMVGVMLAALAFRLWPSTVMVVIAVLNSRAFGGLQLMARCVGILVIGLLIGIVALGFNVHLDTEPLAVAVSIFAIIAYAAFAGGAIYRESMIRLETKRALETEKEKSQQLLLKVFPQVVIPRLHAGESPIADEFADVTVLFADIVGYTALAEQLGPRKTVMLLNDLYKRFDQAAAQFGVEKIETVGDGYLAACGAPERNDHHPEAVAALALAMIEAARQVPVLPTDPVQIRVGIHTGPVFGGVIGEHRFHYAIFGETVNVASRVQSHSRPGGILVSDVTYKRIRGSYRLQECGSLDLKGHGPMRTYWLLGSSQGVE